MLGLLSSDGLESPELWPPPVYDHRMPYLWRVHAQHAAAVEGRLAEVKPCLPLAVAALLAGCGGGGAAAAEDAQAPTKPAYVPAQFGTGDDSERASELATKVLRRELARQRIACEGCLYGPSGLSAAQRAHMKRFADSTEATSSTRTISSSSSTERWCGQSRKKEYVQSRLLIASTAQRTRALEVRQHTVRAVRLILPRCPSAKAA